MRPVQDFVYGATTFLNGLKWLGRNKGYAFILIIPSLLGLAAFVCGLWLFATYDEMLLGQIMFAKPEVWYGVFFYYLCWGLLYVAAVITCLVSAMLLVSIIASPFYEWVSLAVEKEFLGTAPKDLGFVQNLKVIWVETKKALFIFLVTVALLFIPGVNLVATVVTAFLIGWNYFDYPVARRGWSFRERLDFVVRDPWKVMGFGVWLVIPFVQFLVMPLAVVGGTLLGLESLRERERMNDYRLS